MTFIRLPAALGVLDSGQMVVATTTFVRLPGRYLGTVEWSWGGATFRQADRRHRRSSRGELVEGRTAVDRMKEFDYRVALGAYVLGALPQDESTKIARHLVECPDCRREQAQLAEVTMALGLMVDPHSPAAQERDSPVLDALVDSVVRDRRRYRRRYRAALATAIVAVLVAVGTFWHSAGRSEPPPRSGTRASPAPVTAPPSAGDSRTVAAADPRTGVQARAVLTAVAWGTAVELTVRGIVSGERCQLSAISALDRTEEIGSWIVPAGSDSRKAVTITSSISLPLAALTRLNVATKGGRTLVTLPIRR